VANTPVVDRDRDRVFPLGLVLSNFQTNPVLMWGHNYHDPWSLIGRGADMQITPEAFRLKPEWREPASDTDPMHIIRSLIDGGMARALSIGFLPLEWQENEYGGRDYTSAEILEVSLVPIPANQEALRAAIKSLETEIENRAVVVEPEPETNEADEPDGKTGTPTIEKDADAGTEATDADNELTAEDQAGLLELLRRFLDNLKIILEV
jgi:hypothetical protein